MTQVYIALGSNLGVPREQLSQAIDALAALPQTKLIQSSPWYRTAPLGGPQGQPDYLNAACELKTTLAPLDLLHALQGIELQAGRIRLERWGPRTLDLDIIIYGTLEQNDPELTLPHPRAHERAFVLAPLADLNPLLPLRSKPVTEWLLTVKDQAITKA